MTERSDKWRKGQKSWRKWRNKDKRKSAVEVKKKIIIEKQNILVYIY